MSHKPAWLIEADKLRPDVQVIVEHSGPSRSMRRSALKTLRHNTVLYHQEMDRVRALHSARQRRRLAYAWTPALPDAA